MKFLRVGNIGAEKPALLDNNIIRDLSSVIKDIDQTTIGDNLINTIKKLDISKLPQLDNNLRIGACVSNPSIDTIIQNLVLGDTLITCMDSTQLGGDLILINNICENIGGIVNFSLDTLTYCTEVIASQIGQESACIIVCDNFGICDTTILVINITETAPMFLHAADDNECICPATSHDDGCSNASSTHDTTTTSKLSTAWWQSAYYQWRR